MLNQTIEEINKQLKDLFGIDTVTGLTMFRVSWSEDQFEHRYGTYTDYSEDGKIFLREVTETRYVPKYRQWIHNKYILERLVLVPIINASELPDVRLSYEPLWVFEDRNGFPLPPKIEACKLICDTILSSQSISKMMITGDESESFKSPLRARRYSDGDVSNEAHIALHKQRIDNLQEELFGDESGLMGTTHNESSSAIIVPHNYKRVN